ncbi:MAG: PAS domain S-box protein [Flavobacterium sp.]|nr:MAG: PAS domain S-box protein [Flavobacterium sp.]
MKTTPATTHSLQFNYLPSYAQYIIDYKLEDFVRLQFTIAEQLNVPLLKAFTNMPAAEVSALVLKYGKEFLDCLANNQAENFIQTSILRWATNTLPHIDKYQVVSDDLSLISLTRKKVFLQILPSFCQDPNLMINIIEELDYFFTKLNAATTETYINLLKEKIAEHTHLIEKINTTSPSAIYVFDVKDQRTIYTNEKFNDVLGYSNNEMEGYAFNFFSALIHPDDLTIIQSHYQSILTIEDKEIQSCKYRIKNKDGDYCWMRNYDTVFKRKDDHSVWQIIGIVIDVTKEKITADELRKREEQLTEAQALAHMGSWSCIIETGMCKWSDEMYKIYQLEKTVNLDLDFISSFTHPDDLIYSQQQLKKILESKKSIAFQYRIIATDGAVNPGDNQYQMIAMFAKNKKM